MKHGTSDKEKTRERQRLRIAGKEAECDKRITNGVMTWSRGVRGGTGGEMEMMEAAGTGGWRRDGGARGVSWRHLGDQRPSGGERGGNTVNPQNR